MVGPWEVREHVCGDRVLVDLSYGGIVLRMDAPSMRELARVLTLLADRCSAPDTPEGLL